MALTAKSHKTYIYGMYGSCRTEDEFLLTFKGEGSKQEVQLTQDELSELYFKVQRLLQKRAK